MALTVNAELGTIGCKHMKCSCDQSQSMAIFQNVTPPSAWRDVGVQHSIPLYVCSLIMHWLCIFNLLLAHLSRRLTRWAYRMGLKPASVRPSVRPSTLLNMNISETSRPITTKFYLKRYWGGGKAALGFDADQIRSLVSMATDSSHRVIMGKRASSRFLACFWSDSFYTCR